MDTGTIFFFAIVAQLIGLGILYAIIKSATKSTTQAYLSRKQVEYLEIQMRLQAELLKRQGVTNEELIEIINLQNSYFQKES